MMQPEGNRRSRHRLVERVNESLHDSTTPLFQSLVRLKGDSADSQGFYQPREVGSLQAQDLGGGGAVSLGLGECFLNQFPSIVIDCAVIGETTTQSFGRCRNNFGGQVVKRQLRSLPQHDSALNNIGKLADVTRPFISNQLLQSLFRNARKVLLSFPKPIVLENSSPDRKYLPSALSTAAG